MSVGSSLTAFRRSVRYRLGRMYNSFHYSQSNNKYVMLFVFPGVMWYTRYRAETKLGYRLYIAPTAGGPIDYEGEIDASSLMKEAEGPKEDTVSMLLKGLNYVDDTIVGAWNKLQGKKELIDGFKNGKKVYLEDSATVGDLKKMVYGKDALAYADVLVGCKGRVMQNDDNLALSTRAFCKRDPRIVLWRDP
ncbi:hypothetical protein BgAZ_103970 [Babesia gibsoni]|uniref:Uncharacterized protein n=1 Tax=Babesia gibsoni TaxID=33632 RepID=A0AAD8PFI5_BABGI|nr:hypothetical protein BgAZ_103920 [Babesia gibsoni]KAK1444491.1 hypothetical protein BgAZ_103970 [Babesia gibsoni]